MVVIWMRKTLSVPREVSLSPAIEVAIYRSENENTRILCLRFFFYAFSFS